MSRFIRNAKPEDFWQPGRMYARFNKNHNSIRAKFFDRWIGFKRGPFEDFPTSKSTSPGSPNLYRKIEFPILLLDISYHNIEQHETIFHPVEREGRGKSFGIDRSNVKDFDIDDATGEQFFIEVPFMKILDSSGKILYIWLTPRPKDYYETNEILEDIRPVL